MDDLMKKTVLAAGITFIIYMVLFLFFDRLIDLWIHNNCPNSRLWQVGTYISYLAYSDLIKLGLTIGFIMIIIIDQGLTKRWTMNFFISVLAAP
jgi:hypothetical protein